MKTYFAAGIVAASIIAGIAVTQVGAATATDTLIKASTDAVYYLGTDNKRYVFPNEKIFKTWYKDFSSVITISDQELATYPIGGNVRYHPGTRLVKVTTDPKVYAVGSNGNLYPIASEQAAVSLYGTNWAQQIDDLPDVYVTDYVPSLELNGTSHPEGTLFRYSDSANTYFVLQMIDAELRARSVSTTMLNQYGLNANFAAAINRASFTYPTGDALTQNDIALRYPSQKGITTETPETPIETPAPSPATLTVAPLASLPSKLMAVRDDDEARLYGFTLTGDKTHDMTMTDLLLHFYIDAGGSDPDFTEGTDIDEPGNWAVNLVVRDLALRDIATGAILARVSSIDGEGRAAFNTNFVIKAGTKTDVEVIGNINTAPTKVRLAVGFTPGKELLAVSSTASTLTVSPATILNGGLTPSIVVELKNFGTLKISTANKGADAFQHLGATFSPFSLVFTATGEPFTVRSLSFETTTEGPTALVVNELSLTYKTVEGKTEIDTHNSLEDKRFTFINLDIYVPKNGSVEIPLSVLTSTQTDVYSNSRVQFKFVTDDFFAHSEYSNLQYSPDQFADSTKLVNSTGVSALTIFREANMVFATDPSTPTGVALRSNKKPVMTFRITAKEGPVKIYKMVFRIETSDINIAGDDNDYLEQFADVFASERSGLYFHGEELLDRPHLNPQSITYQIYDSSAGVFDDTPRGLQTGNGDYGLLVYSFGGNAITLNKDQSILLDFDLDTTLFSTDKSNTFRVRLLGDSKQAATSEANFLWEDGTHINASGFLISGLDLSSASLSVDKL